MKPEVVNGKVQQPGRSEIAQVRRPVNRQQRREMERHPERYLEPLKQGGVVVAHIDPGNPEGEFLDSIEGLLNYDGRNARLIFGDNGGGTMRVWSGPRIAATRNQVVLDFLTSAEFAGADWLFLVDSDMTFDPDTVDRLLASAEKHQADVMGALCFAGGRSTMYPTLYRLLRDEDGALGVEPVEDYPRNAVVKVGATGAAGILVSRSILVRLLADHPDGYGTLPENGKTNPHPWFVEGHHFGGNKPLGEDVAFCIRVNAVGGSVYVDTSVKMGHVKKFQLTEELWDERREAEALRAEVTALREEVATLRDQQVGVAAGG